MIKRVFAIIFFLVCSVPLFAQDSNDNEMAMQYYQNGEYQKSAVLLEKLLFKTKSEAYLDLYFNALLKSKQYESADKAIKKLIRQNPGTLKYELIQGRIYKEKGDPENSAKTFDHLLHTLPDDEAKIRSLANDIYQLGEYDLAISVFLQGRKNLKNDQAFTFELLSLYRFKKDKNKLSEEYLNALSTMPQMLQQAETVIPSVFENNADYLMLQTALLKRLQKDPQNESYSRLLIWQYLQQKDYEMALRQLIAQDKRIKDNGTILFEHAQLFTSNKAYEMAIKAYSYLLLKGKENEFYLPSKLALIDARYQLLRSGKSDKKDVILLADQYQEILDEYGSNTRTLFALRKWANLQTYYLQDPKKAETALEAALKIPGISSIEMGEMKLELGDIYRLTQQPWEAILMYGQVAKEFENQNIGTEAKYRSARLSFEQGNFSYAKSQADILKASTEQLIANDALNLSLLISDHLETATDTLALKMYAAAEALQFRNLSAAAIAKVDSIPFLYPKNSLTDDILMFKSDIHIKNKDFMLAVPLLKELINHQQKGNWADEALFILAGLYEDQLNDPEQAKTLYQQLITDFPGSMFVTEARKHFRRIRGDNIES
ncbi:tetratricopeptide (TPR) repeat protein [Pedobacter cryoconitis]|uniref:Tetratricopeptide (TPR) repeat protein n=1 Tax=Pedobacter cryoconitis TaxID=188932 RepID=A0A7W9DYB3_9SPHI|nr:tetratricopeptide repeat protein [Pedobacter cryoconitis]MBB5635813.1 tetratricopeptide (TPR) repeat protein [Pedobacter cryoconitis]